MKFLTTLLLVSLAFTLSVNAEFEEDCLACMCKGYGCTLEAPSCFSRPWGWVCGPFQINWGYWADGGKLGESVEKCSSEWECSKQTVRNYVTHYMGSNNTCENYARVHMGGPWNMNSAAATQYWEGIQGCLELSPPFVMPTDVPTA